MDDYTFRYNVDRCRSVVETTSYLEILSFSDPSFNTIKENELAPEEFDNFLHRKACFEAPRIPDGIILLGGIRLILQKNARHRETFAPFVISLKADVYKKMVNALHLPYRAIESTSCVGSFLWSALDQDSDNPHLHIVQRKSDVRKKGMTRGWEVMLSYEFRTGITSGFCKGTPSSDIVECIKHLKACISEIQHPLVLPIIIFGHESSPRSDMKQREARAWLRQLEHAVSMRSEIEENEGYVSNGVVDLDGVNRDLVECHSQDLWKRPVAFLQIIDTFKETMEVFWEQLAEERRTPSMKALQGNITSKLGFYKKKWQGVEIYANVTLQRLEIQRNALYNIIAQKESKLNFQMAGDQRKLAYASKRESTAMKVISLLGSIFLPGAYLASVFSTTFFDFQNGPDIASAVSPNFWLYWIVTIPVTVIVVGMWVLWEKRRQKLYDMEDADLEIASDNMERDIMAAMRKRTVSKFTTWQATNVKKSKLARDDDNDFGGGYAFNQALGDKKPS